MPDWRGIAEQLDVGELRDARSVHGGDIAAAWCVATGNESLFIKTADAGRADMFVAEAAGLTELAGAKAVRTPTVRGTGVAGGDAWLALEWLPLQRGNNAAAERLGRELAELHRHTAEQHGWHRDNTIGLTPQPNAWSDDWVEFFRERRLVHQLELAARQGYRGDLEVNGQRLADRLDALFADYTPVPSLLHGDLWGGNWGVADNEPVIFDPAVYYGDREADLAMTRLFGGFGGNFYSAYEATWPLADGHELRDALYRLYHVLNHLNLFGGGYLGQALSLLERLNRAI